MKTDHFSKPLCGGYNAVRRLAIAGLMLQCFVLSCNVQEDSRLAQSVSVAPDSLIPVLESMRGVVFYDSTGKIIKVIETKDIPRFNPLYQLPFPKDTSTGHRRHFLPLCEDNGKGQLVHHIKIAPKVRIINEFGRKHHLSVRKPEDAGIIGIGNNIESTGPYYRFVCFTESGYIRNVYGKGAGEDSSGFFRPNTVLDCSSVSVYNHGGGLVYQKLLPNLLIAASFVSDDGRFLLLDCAYGFQSEGSFDIPAGLVLIDMHSDRVEHLGIKRKEARYGIYADQNFQINYDDDQWLFINPYTRIGHQVRLPKEQVKGKSRIFPYQSFRPFEGVYIDLREYPSFSF